MNHRPRTALCSLLLVCAASAALLSASLPAAAQIPPAARGAADATAAATFRPQIDAFVKGQVARLGDTKTPRAIHEARIQLESQVPSSATPSFMQVYAASLNTNIQPLASSTELITRLNAAIVVAHVAERVKNAELAPAAAKFMSDSQDAVALWGVKAAKQIIPVVLNVNPTQDTLSPILMNCVKKNWYSGAIMYEAYDAYRLNTANPAGPGVPIAPGTFPPATTPAVKAAITNVLGLLAFRADLYAKGVPPQPAAEKVAFEFLGRQKVWQQVAPAQQPQLMQLLVNILSFAGQHAAVVDPEPVAAIADMLAQEGSTITVIGGFVGDPATSDAAKPLRSFGPTTPGDVVSTTAKTAVDALLAAKWKTQLKAPPMVADAGKLLSPNDTSEDEAAPPAAPAPAAGGGPAGKAAAPAAAQKTGDAGNAGNTPAGGGGAAAGAEPPANGAAGAGAGAKPGAR